MQRTFLGQVVSARPCSACQGYGTVIPHPCATCGGDGRVRTRRTLTVKIPAGVEDGMRIRLAQQGEVGPGGGPPGDLYVEIHERPHDVYSRKGDDLHCRVTVPMTAAALGTRLTIKTLDGEEALDVRAGTQPRPRCASAARACRTCAAPAAATCSCTSTCGRPTKLEPEQERLLREFARSRGEEVAELSQAGRLLLPDARRLQRSRLTGRAAAAVPGRHAALPVTGATGRLDGPEGHHAADVQRLRVGETLLLARRPRRAGHGHGHVASRSGALDRRAGRHAARGRHRDPR